VTVADPFPNEVRDEVRLLRHEISTLAAEMAAVRRRAEQIAALRDEETESRIERLERVLDYDRTTAHVRAAVSQSNLARDPVAHMYVPDLFPPDVYDALVEAIPPAAFFETDPLHAAELRMPPRLAPAHSIVTWAFLTEVVLEVLSPALVSAFAQPLGALTSTLYPALPPLSELDVEVTLSHGRLVRRTRGYQATPSPDREWDFLTAVVCLARPGDGAEFGSRLDGRTFPFNGNSALVFLQPAHAHTYESIPDTVRDHVQRHTYEFGVGPTQAGRRALAASGVKQAPGTRPRAP
jgi:hypothetical protein